MSCGWRASGRVDVQFGGATQQAEGGDESEQPEAVVAVEVGDEDVVEPRELQPTLAQLQLGTLATIYHEKLVAHVEHLRGGIVARGGQGRPAAEDMQFELFHGGVCYFRSYSS